MGRAQAGFPNLLTVDVGGTSTDVALIQNGEPRLRRETTVGDVTVRASRSTSAPSAPAAARSPTCPS
jgi:N-methylhydantoinase A/oxoprolinase/acetone carboxylase beta subunit